MIVFCTFETADTQNFPAIYSFSSRDKIVQHTTGLSMTIPGLPLVFSVMYDINMLAAAEPQSNAVWYDGSHRRSVVVATETNPAVILNFNLWTTLVTNPMVPITRQVDEVPVPAVDQIKVTV